MLSSANVPRFGGLVGVLAGVLSIAHGLFLILLRPHYWAASSFSDYLSIVLTSIGLLLLVGALIGLHARQTGRCGKLERLEKISFFLAVLGATVAAVSNVAEDWFHIPFMGGVFIASIFILLLGLLLMAIAMLGANVLPRWCGWVLLVGLLGLLLNNHLLPDGGGMILFGLTWIVLGYALWKNQGAGAIKGGTMDRFLRSVLIIVSILSLILAAGFCLQLSWATRLWPWADSSLPYLFLGSITAAAAASLLWIGLSGEFGALVGGAIHLIVFYAGLALSLFLLSQQGGDQRLPTGALACLVVSFISVAILLWCRRYPIQGHRPMPLLVRVSFVVFIVVLVFAGIAILLQIPNVFAWKLTQTSSVLIGCFFLGASCYFLYGLLRPSWQNSSGQLWAFLAYDLVLIIPFLLRFASVSPERLPSLIINTVVLVFSGALAVYYLLVNKATRTWGESSGAARFLKAE